MFLSSWVGLAIKPRTSRRNRVQLRSRNESAFHVGSQRETDVPTRQHNSAGDPQHVDAAFDAVPLYISIDDAPT